MKKLISFKTVTILVIILFTSCKNEPAIPERFGVYVLNGKEYLELERRDIKEGINNLGKPTAREISKGKRWDSFMRDPRFGKDHVITNYYLSVENIPFYNLEQFQLNGFIIIGEAITNCELIRIPDKVNEYHNSKSDRIVFKVKDSWGRKNYTPQKKVSLMQSKTKDNIYKFIPSDSLEPGIYFINYKSYGQTSSYGYNPIIIKNKEEIKTINQLIKAEADVIDSFLTNQNLNYNYYGCFYYSTMKEGKGSVPKLLKNYKIKVTVKFIDGTNLYTSEIIKCEYKKRNNKEYSYCRNFPYQFRMNIPEIDSIILQTPIGSIINFLITSKCLFYGKFGREIENHYINPKLDTYVPPYTPLFVTYELIKK